MWKMKNGKKKQIHFLFTDFVIILILVLFILILNCFDIKYNIDMRAYNENVECRCEIQMMQQIS